MRDLRDAPASDHAKAKHRVTAKHGLVSHGAPAIRGAARASSAAPRAAATRPHDPSRIGTGSLTAANGQHRRSSATAGSMMRSPADSAQAARQHHEIGVDDSGDSADRTSDGPTRGREDVDGVAVVGAGRRHDVGRSDGAAEPAYCGLRHGAAAGVELEASDAAAGAPRALGLHLEMAEFATQTTGADEQLPIDHHPAADAGAKQRWRHSVRAPCPAPRTYSA